MKKNVWFLVCGILSIIEAVAMGLMTVIFFVFSSMIKSGDFNDLFTDPQYTLTQQELDMMASMLNGMAIFMLIMLAVAIFCAVVYLKYRNKTPQEIKTKSGLILTAIVLSFFVGGILVGIFGVLGYNKVNEEKTETFVAGESSSKDLKSKLDELNKVKEAGMISEEEYAKKREDLINKL